MPAADLELLLNALREAGRIALKFHRNNPKHWQKSDGSYVTEGDLAVDDYLKNTIASARPEDGWLSEETPDTPARLGKSRLWIVDPIDGTQDYLNGGSNWGIGAALIVDGRPTVSVLHKPFDDVMYHASEGEGAFRNGAPLIIDSGNASLRAITHRKYVKALTDAGLTTQTGSRQPLLLRFSCIAEGKPQGVHEAPEAGGPTIRATTLLL